MNKSSVTGARQKNEHIRKAEAYRNEIEEKIYRYIAYDICCSFSY